MTRVASGVPCYQAALAAETCDFWQATLPNDAAGQPLVPLHRHATARDTDYYGDDTAALDGGLGATTDDAARLELGADASTTARLHDAPLGEERGRSTRSSPTASATATRRTTRRRATCATTDRGQAAVERAARGLLPRLRRRRARLPVALRRLQPAGSPTKERRAAATTSAATSRASTSSSSYLQALGVNTIYFNPIFESVEPRLRHRRLQEDRPVLRDAEGLRPASSSTRTRCGMRIILDGVFNHMSSDSPLFDRYHHYRDRRRVRVDLVAVPRAGSCSRDTHVPCTLAATTIAAGSASTRSRCSTSRTRRSRTTSSARRTASRALAEARRGRLAARRDGRQLVPGRLLEAFRQVVKATDPNALIVGELWQKDSTLLRILARRPADTTMNYRAATRPRLPTRTRSTARASATRAACSHRPSSCSRLVSQQEDYPDAAYYSLMNLLDSHDTTRALWTLTPGAENDPAAKATPTRADGKRAPAARLADPVHAARAADRLLRRRGRRHRRRRPGRPAHVPVAEQGGKPDLALAAHYGALGLLRAAAPVLARRRPRAAAGRRRDGHGRLRAQDGLAGRDRRHRQGRRRDRRSRSRSPASSPTARRSAPLYGVGNAFGGTFTASGGAVHGAAGAAVGARARHRRRRPDAAGRADRPARHRRRRRARSSLAWTAVAGRGRLRRLPQPAHGRRLRARSARRPATTLHRHAASRTASPQYYVVRALDARRQRERPVERGRGRCRISSIGWANLQWPPTLARTRCRPSTADSPSTARSGSTARRASRARRRP